VVQAMTHVRGKRGRLVHIVTSHGSRRDLAPEEIPTILCGKKLRGAIITDDDVSCDACLDVLFNAN
jgi:hypothetical protein